MIYMPFCFGEAPANRLTNAELDPVGKIPEFKYTAARVSRASSRRGYVAPSFHQPEQSGDAADVPGEPVEESGRVVVRPGDADADDPRAL
jgi:predicted molibdopterin-dependent oxidoreductase YjgC